MSKVIVERREEGSYQEYPFTSLKEAFEFIEQSEKTKRCEDGSKPDGVYEIHMPRSYK